MLPISVLAGDLLLPADQIRSGRILFQQKCAACHGHDAAGDSGPDVQGMILPEVQEAAEGFEAMPEIDLTEAEATRIAVFLMSLAPDQARIRLGMD